MTDYFNSKAISIIAAKSGVRLDANETSNIERTLTQLRTTVYEDIYEPLIGRTLMPFASDIAADADTYSYQVDSLTGKASIGASSADNPPRVGAKSREVLGKVYNITDSFGYDVLDIARAARLGNPLSVRLARAARTIIEQGIDTMLAFGHTGSPGETNTVTSGLLNNTDIEGAGAARVQSLTNWTAASDPDDILGELFALSNAPGEETDGAYQPTDMVLPLARFNVINSLKVGVDSDKTVLAWFLSNSTNVKSVRGWGKAEGIGANSTGRALVYRKDPMILEGIVPQEFAMLPPQAKNFEFEVPCYARCGGVKVYAPSANAYGDFAA